MKGLIFTYALVALGVGGAFYTPLIGLCVYVGFAILRPQFMWGWAADLGGLSLMVGVATLLSWALRGFGSWGFGRARGIVVAMLMYAVWVVLSGLQAANEDVAWAYVVNLSKVALPFMAGATLIHSQSWARRMLWVIVISQAYVCLEMNLSYLNGFNQVQRIGYGGMDNNSFAIGLVASLGPAIGFVIGGRTLMEKALASFASVLILHTVLLTFSRGAMVGLLAIGVAAFIVMPKRPKQLAVVVAALLLTIRLTGPELLARYNTTFVAEQSLDASAGSRVDLWRDCLTVAFSNPFFGIGPDHWPLVASTFGWTAGKEAHSVWMQGAAELGFPGVLALMAVFALTIIKLWPLARVRGIDAESNERSALATGVLVGTVGYVVSAQFVSLEGLETPYYIVMSGVGLLRSLPVRSAETVPAPARSVPATRIAPRPIPARVPPSPRAVLRPRAR